MSILPEKIVRTRATSNGYFSEIFSLENWVNLNIFWFIIIFLVFVFVSPGISAILLILFCIDIDQYEKPISLNIIAMLVSTYLLVDIHKKWIMSVFYMLFFDAKELQTIIRLNYSSLGSNLFVFVFAEELYNFAGQNKFISLIYILGLLFLGYLLTFLFF